MVVKISLKTARFQCSDSRWLLVCYSPFNLESDKTYFVFVELQFVLGLTSKWLSLTGLPPPAHPGPAPYPAPGRKFLPAPRTLRRTGKPGDEGHGEQRWRKFCKLLHHSYHVGNWNMLCLLVIWWVFNLWHPSFGKKGKHYVAFWAAMFSLLARRLKLYWPKEPLVKLVSKNISFFLHRILMRVKEQLFWA